MSELGLRVELKTKLLLELQKLQPEMVRVCPIAGRAIQEAFVTFQRGAVWEAFRYLGEASGAIEVYIAVATKDLENAPENDSFAAYVNVYQNLKTWLMVLFSSAHDLANLEWERKKVR